MFAPKTITNLIESFEKLPGIGPKTAARLTYYLLHVPQTELDKFSEAVSNLKKNTLICSVCKNVGETEPCDICQDPNRDKSKILVVEQPLDILAVERTGKYKGRYHVLHGAISPLQNIGPDEIFIQSLAEKVKSDKDILEIIIATNPNIEGEATAAYLVKLIKQIAGENLKVTRLARGLPMGGDLEFADEVTLGKAIDGRGEY